MITTHVLDLSSGSPAVGVRVVLVSITDGQRSNVARAVTDSDGRVRDLLPASATLDAAVYELTFETGAYFAERRVPPFHPRVIVTFEITDPAQHYHVPLLISPYGYTTYRGS